MRRRLQLLAAVETNAHVAARHYYGIGLLTETNGALRHLFLRRGHPLHVLHLALVIDFVRVVQAEDRLYLERHPVYQHYLFGAADARYFVLGVFCEHAVVDECVVLTLLAVVNRYDQGSVLFVLLCQLEVHQSRHLEVNHPEYYLLLHARCQVHRLYVVLPVGRIKHYGHVVLVALLGDTATYADIAVDLGIDDKGQLQHGPTDLRLDGFGMYVALQLEALQIINHILLLLPLLVQGFLLLHPPLPIYLVELIVTPGLYLEIHLGMHSILTTLPHHGQHSLLSLTELGRRLGLQPDYSGLGGIRVGAP